MRFNAIVLPFLCVSSVVGSTLVPRSIPQRGCGTHITKEKKDKVEAAFRIAQATARRPAARGKVVIDTYFHVVAQDRTLEGGWVPESQIRDQVAVLNGAYAQARIGFDLKNITYTINPTWFHRVTYDTDYNEKMKKSLQRGDRKTLNIYTVAFDSPENYGLLGYATFPDDYEELPWDDGVVVQYATLPGGTLAPYNQGHTLTHETGHWFGLYHTFQGGCTGGDEVEDTPPQFEPTNGCPTYKKDTCPGDDKDDPIHNFMDYSSDDCLTEFTPGQSERMANQNIIYRNFLPY